jgi:hypothetical protein
MLLIPYFKDITNPNWLQLSLFLCEGGNSIWSIPDDMTDKEIKELLKDNGFPVVKLEHHDSTIYALIDRSKLSMSDFYQWDEINPNAVSESKDVWRSLQIPLALLSCPVFKEHFWKSARIPCCVTTLV